MLLALNLGRRGWDGENETELNLHVERNLIRNSEI